MSLGREAAQKLLEMHLGLVQGIRPSRASQDAIQAWPSQIWLVSDYLSNVWGPTWWSSNPCNRQKLREGGGGATT